MKRVFALLVLLLAVFSLAGCGENDIKEEKFSTVPQDDGTLISGENDVKEEISSTVPQDDSTLIIGNWLAELDMSEPVRAYMAGRLGLEENVLSELTLKG